MSQTAWQISTPKRPNTRGKIKIKGMKKMPLRAAASMLAERLWPVVCKVMLHTVTTAAMGKATSCQRRAMAPTATTLPTQGDGAHGNHLGVVTQDVHQLLGEHKGGTAHDQQHGHVKQDGEVEALEQAFVQASAVVETAEGLVTLSHADDDGKDDESQSRNNRHTGYRGVAIHACGHVQHQCGDAGQRLARERRCAALEDFLLEMPLTGGLPEVDGDVLALA